MQYSSLALPHLAAPELFFVSLRAAFKLIVLTSPLDAGGWDEVAKNTSPRECKRILHLTELLSSGLIFSHFALQFLPLFCLFFTAFYLGIHQVSFEVHRSKQLGETSCNFAATATLRMSPPPFSLKKGKRNIATLNSSSLDVYILDKLKANRIALDRSLNKQIPVACLPIERSLPPRIHSPAPHFGNVHARSFGLPFSRVRGLRYYSSVAACKRHENTRL